MRRDHKHDYAFRPLEKALLAGTVDAIYTQSKVFQHIQEATGQLAMIEDLSRYPDWRIQVANTPAVITCTDVMADEHPELVIAYMKAMIKVGRWANENKHAAGAILNRQTFYLDAEDTYQGIKDVDMVPSLSARNLQTIKIGKDFMFSHGYIKHDFDVDEWARPEFLEQAATRSSRRSGSAGAGASCPRAAGSRWKASGSASRCELGGRIGLRSGRLGGPAASVSADPGVHARGCDLDLAIEENDMTAVNGTRMQQLGYRAPEDVPEPDQLVLVDYVSDGRVAIVTLNRPHADNAVTTALAAQLIEILETINARASVRVAILTSAGDGPSRSAATCTSASR